MPEGFKDPLLVIRPVTTAVQIEAIRAAALADPQGHVPIFPSHVCMLGDEIVGSLSIAASPVMGIWAHSQKSRPRHSLEMFNVARNLMRVVVPGRRCLTMCAETSPLYPFVERMDFAKLGVTTLFLSKEET